MAVSPSELTQHLFFKNYKMAVLKLYYFSGTVETLTTKTLESAAEIIRRRNATGIVKATFKNEPVDLEPFKKVYGRPKQFLEKLESVRSIQAGYSKNKGKTAILL
jgi:hypothetical protein